MKPWIIPGLAGFFIGGALVFSVQAFKGNSKADGRIAELEQALTKTQQEATSQTAKLESLRQASASLPAPTPTPTEPAPAAALPATPDREAQRKAFMERMAERSIARWSSKLKLTPDQIARLKLMADSLLQDPSLDPRNWGAIEAELLKVLTPEQKAAYDHIQNREAQARQELRVNSELYRVQTLFDLTDTQKDQIFQKFAAIEVTPASTASTPGAQSSERDERNQKRVDALAGILTPEQLQEYADTLNNNSNGRSFGGR